MKELAEIIAAVAQIIIALGVILNIIITRKHGADIHKIEVATNSMKDALVAASEDKGYRAGQADARGRK